ncbi:MAG: hypothetical protein FD153_231 [Rhodospirillaceae bacterium]|nr:MAG: hypothetical protein FD153_231 [Rhodospirillaceae bacterium]
MLLAEWWLLTFASLGLLYPVQRVQLWAYLWNRACFGRLPFCFTGRARTFYRSFWPVTVAAALFLVGSALLIPILIAAEATPTLLIPAALFMGSIVLFSKYKAAELQFLADSLSLGEIVRFTADFPFGSLAWLIVSNGLPMLVTLGLGAAHASLRTLRFVCAHVSLRAQPNFAAITQSAASRRGFRRCVQRGLLSFQDENWFQEDKVTIAGGGYFCDGRTALRHEVTVAIEDDRPATYGPGEARFAGWSHAELRRVPGPMTGHELILTCRSNPDARLIITDGTVNASLQARLPFLSFPYLGPTGKAMLG